MDSADCEVVRRLVEEVANRGRMTLVDDLVSADFQEHVGPPGLPSDREALKQALASRRLFGSGSDYAISELRDREGLIALTLEERNGKSRSDQLRPSDSCVSSPTIPRNHPHPSPSPIKGEGTRGPPFPAKHSLKRRHQSGETYNSRGARQDCRPLGSRAPVRHSHLMTTSTKSWKLSPSDFAFLWEECKRCFYLKVARGFYRPRTPFPGIFSVIDRLMNEYFNGRPNAEISDTLPPGVVKYGESWVESRPLPVPGHASTCFYPRAF